MRRKKICLIVDEITSGWRETIGGIYKKVGFKPDIVVYGKGLGNGYAISAIVGKKKFMDVANHTFMSSTAWTERIGFVAAISTIEFFKKNKVNRHIVKIGREIQKIWHDAAKKNKIDIKINDFSPLCTFNFNYKKKSDELYTLFSQEMLKRGYIASNSVYVSYEHKLKDLKNYRKSCIKVFSLIKKAVQNNNFKIKGRARSVGFKRLT